MSKKNNHKFKLLQTITIAFIRTYQVANHFIRGVVLSQFGFVSECRHSPTCSQYTILSIRKHGTMPGLWRGLKRVARCYF